ncbi:MAG: S9 family peptidase [Thermoanaerobaculia bacterium]
MAHVGLVLATLLAVPNASASPSVGQVFDALEGVRGFHSVAISADGSRAAWSQKVRDAEGRDRLGRISVAAVPGGAPRPLSAAADGQPAKEKCPVFSPDGKTIAFLSDAGAPGQSQVWLAPAAGGPPRRLTSVKGQLDDPRWSPDGKSVAFLFVEGSSQETGALVAHARDSGVVEETPEEQRIAVADAATGRVAVTSPPNLYVYDYDWAPDGKSFAAEAAKGSGTNNYWFAELYVVDRATGAARSIWKPPLQLACPRFSPDGKSVAVIHGIMSDEGSNGGDVYEVPVSGGAAHNLTPGMPASADDLLWRPSGEILVPARADGGSALLSLDPKTQRRSTLWSGAESLRDFAIARSGSASAAAFSSFRSAPEVRAGPIGAWKPLTAINAAVRPFWGDARSLHWSSAGTSVQGWLLYPLAFDPAKRYPMVVVAHGGPSGASDPVWPSRWTATLPSQGYFVFLPNPRGSFGFGEAFAQANVKDFGGGDLADILAGIDAVLKSAPVDPGRLGITGWSYGGYMTMWAVTQTDRFAAAVAGAGIASWQSYYGQNKIDTWMLPFFAASVYDDPKVYARCSPMEFIKNVKTPTLVLHGERDSEVPTPQGYEFWHALKTRGVPTQLVIYSDEGHAVSRSEHQRDIVTRSAAWFDRYLK